MIEWRRAWRALAATPAVTIAAVLSLALGLGAAIAIFVLVNALLLQTLPVASPEQLATVTSEPALKLGFTSGAGWSARVWDRFKEQPDLFEGAFAWHSPRVGLGQGGERRPADAILATGDFFDTLGLATAVGRPFGPADDVRGGGPDGPVVVLSDRAWRRDFDRAPSAIGTTLFIEGVPFTIVGVTAPSFTGLEVGRAFDILLPLSTEPLFRGPRAVIDQPRAYLLSAMVRLRPGQSREKVIPLLQQRQAAMLSGLDVPRFVNDPMTLASAGSGVEIPGSARPKYARALTALLVVAALVFAGACINNAGLLSARVSAMGQELATRVALGATGFRLARSFAAEAILLSVPGAIGGCLLGILGARAVIGMLPITLTAPFDGTVLAFAAGAGGLAALVLAVAAGGLSSSVAQGRDRNRGARMLDALVVIQVAVSLVLIFAAGLFIGTLARLSRVPLGFAPGPVLLAQVDVSATGLGSADLFRLAADSVEAIAGVHEVRSAAASLATPISGGLQMNVPRRPGAQGDEVRVVVNAVTPGWFDVYSTALTAGRDFSDGDTSMSPPVAIVNTAFVELIFPDRPAIGEVVSGRTIVGVVENQVLHSGFKPDGTPRSRRDAGPPIVYVPFAQSEAVGMPNRATFIISATAASGDPVSAFPAVARALTSVDGGLAFSFQMLEDELSRTLAQERVVAWLSGGFGALGLLLATLGLYGVTTLTVHRQRAQLGIRMALGATPAGVRRGVLARVATLVGAGLVVGAVASIWLSRFVEALLVGVRAGDLGTLVMAAAVLMAVSLAAAWVPATKATRANPADVFRVR